MRPLPGLCLDCHRFRRVRVEMLAGIPLGICPECEARLGPADTTPNAGERTDP